MKIYELYPHTLPFHMNFEDVLKYCKTYLESSINIKIKYVDKFTNYKFEEFVSLV